MRSLVTVLTEGSETPKFKTYFVGWPQTDNPKLYEEGKGKVAGNFSEMTHKKKLLYNLVGDLVGLYYFAAMFKQQGYDVTELPEEYCQPLIDCRGKLEVSNFYHFIS